MLAFVFGGLMLVLGLLLLFGALPFAHHVARLWPQRHSRGSAELLASSSFFHRFLGIALTLAGIGVILFELIPE